MSDATERELAHNQICLPRFCAGSPSNRRATLYMLYVIIMTLLNPKLAPKLPAEERNVPFTTVLWALVTSFAPLAGQAGQGRRLQP